MRLRGLHATTIVDSLPKLASYLAVVYDMRYHACATLLAHCRPNGWQRPKNRTPNPSDCSACLASDAVHGIGRRGGGLAQGWARGAGDLGEALLSL